MPDIAIFRVISAEIRNDLAESFRIQSFVHVTYGRMDIFLRRRNSSLPVTRRICHLIVLGKRLFVKDHFVFFFINAVGAEFHQGIIAKDEFLLDPGIHSDINVLNRIFTNP